LAPAYGSVCHWRKAAGPHPGVRSAVPCCPGGDEDRLLARLPCRQHHGPGRRVHAVDVQARDVRRGGEPAGRRAQGSEWSGSDRARPAGARGARHGRLSAAIHRGHASLGERASAPRGAAKNLMDARTVLIDHLPALPEVLLLAGACALMIVDLYVKSERRDASFGLAQIVLLLCALATLYVFLVQAQADYSRLLLFNGLFVSDTLSNLLKLVS